MNRIHMTLTAWLFAVVLAGCGSDPQASMSFSGEIHGDDLIQFFEAHQSTGNEYATLKAADGMFAVGRRISDDGLDVLDRDSLGETPEQWTYRIVLIQNEGLRIGGLVSVDKKSQTIAKSEFYAKKYRL